MNMAAPSANFRCAAELLARTLGLSKSLVADKLAAFAVRDAGALAKLTGESLAENLLEALLVHETYFFRHPPQWQALAETALPDLLNWRTDGLVAWCAGVSTGEEAWSLASLLQQRTPKPARILGTDISAPSLRIASAGIYRRAPALGSFRQIPPFADASFALNPGQTWSAPQVLRRLVRFERHNVMAPPPLGAADIVFCRNTLIYFSDDAAARALRNFAAVLRAGGLLLLGAAETVRDCDLFEPVPRCDGLIYRRTTVPPR